MIEDREIGLAWIEATVVAPDWTDTDPRDSALTRSFKVIGQAAGKVLRVVHRQD